MIDIEVGKHKSGDKKSTYFGGSVWVTMKEHHNWKQLCDLICYKAVQNKFIVQYKAAWIGFQIWLAALDKGVDIDEIEAIIMEHVDTASAREKVVGGVSDALDAWAQQGVRDIEEKTKRDKRLLDNLDDKGWDEFYKQTLEKDPNFDALAWMKRMGMAYDLPWYEKTRRLLIAYFQEYGDTPRAEVIKWASEIGLIGEGVGTVNAFTKLASEAGFSGAAPQGLWGCPERLKREKVNVDIKKLEGVDNLMGII